MKAPFLVFLLVAVALANDSSANSRKLISQRQSQDTNASWESNKVYHYNVVLRSLTALGESGRVDSKWAGFQMNARLTLESQSEEHLSGRLSEVVYGHVHHNFNGWNDPLPSDVQKQSYPGIEGPFEIRMRGGLVEELFVSNEMSQQDENLLKGLLGALQFDPSSKNLIDKKYGFFDDHNGVFRKMESEVTGECETLYAVNVLPLNVLQNDPELAPFVDTEQFTDDDREAYLDVMKTKNYANCDKRVAYNFGAPRGASWENTAQYPNNFMSRNTFTRMFVRSDDLAIISSYVVDQIYASPVLYSEDQAKVISAINMTLVDVGKQTGSKTAQSPSSLRSAGNLIFSMDSDSDKDFKDQKQNQGNARKFQGNKAQQQNSIRSRARRHLGAPKFITDLFRHPHPHANINKNPAQPSPVIVKVPLSVNSGPGFFPSSRSDANSKSDSPSSPSDDALMKKPSLNSAPATLINTKDIKLQSNVNYVDSTVKILKEIVQDMKTPSKMPEFDTLSKINNLVNWISLMHIDELNEVSKRIEEESASNPDMRFSGGMIFIDAVAESGTPSAYTFIKSMILSKKIEGEFAAQLVGTLANSIRYPTKQLRDDFLSFAFEHSVSQQRYLNVSLVTSVTKLIGKAFNEEHQYYPTYVFGRFVNEREPSNALLVLEQKLREAIRMGDSSQAQVFIHAIGNLAHSSIVKIFSPYLERKVRVTEFLRQHMVMSLSDLAKYHPKDVRYILYNIYNNQGEDYGVRVACTFQLLKASPTKAMLLQMASDTHTDSSIHVRSAIASGIRHAAELKAPRFEKLARYAQEAREILSGEDYGFQYSAKYLEYFFSEEFNIGHFQSLALIGSDDSIFHKAFAFTSEGDLGGWMQPSKVQAGISSISRFIELFKNYVGGNNKQSNSKDNQSKYSTEYIAKFFPIQGDREEPLEANVFINLFNQERFFAFDQVDFENLPRSLMQIASELRKGVNVHYRKFYNRQNVEINFPTATGVMYFYKFKNPVFVQIEGKVQSMINSGSQKYSAIPESVNTTSQIDFVYASDYDGKVGFYCPFGDKFISSGIISKYQVNSPLKMKIDMDFENNDVKVDVSSLNGKQEVELLRHIDDRYTSIRERDSTVVPSQHPKTEFIRDPQRAYSMNKLFGQQSTGMAFHLESESDEKLEWVPYEMLPKSFMVNSYLPWARQYHSYKNISVKYNPNQSDNDRIVFSFSYDNNSDKRQQKQQQQSQPWTSAAQTASEVPSDVSADSQHRQEELLQKVASGISGVRASLFDFGVQFLGQKKAEYAATFAAASSPVDQKVQAVFFYSKTSADGKPFQIYSAISGKIANAPTLDFQKALKFETSAQYDVQMNYGPQAKSGTQFNMKVQMQQTPQRREYLKQDPMANLCLRQMAKGNFLMPACENATYSAHMMDSINFHVTYKNIDEYARTLSGRLLGKARQYSYFNLEEDWFNTNGKENTIDAVFQATPDLERFSVSVNTPVSFIQFDDLYLNPWVRNIVVMNPTIPFYEQFAEDFYNNQYTPTCALDFDRVNTFGNRTYEYKTKNCWHVAMHNGSYQTSGRNPSMFTSPRQATVLVRENGGQKELRIHYRSWNGDVINVELKKDKSITVNGKQLPVAPGRIAEVLDQRGDSQLLMAYYITSDELSIDIEEGNLQIVSDGKHVLLKGSDAYRNSTNGLCGSMNSEPLYDLSTPNNCFLRDDKLFGATWAMAGKGEQCNEDVQKLQKVARGKPCIFRQEQSPTIHEAMNYHNDEGCSSSSSSESDCSDSDSSYSSSDEIVGSKNNNKLNKSKDWLKSVKGNCVLRRVTQVFQQSGKICISAEPLDACNSNCKSQDFTQMTVDVVCRRFGDSAFASFKKVIESGHNIQLDKNLYKPNEKSVFLVPKSCNA